MEAIRIRAVTKSFQGVAALKELTFSISTGRLVGLLGINGAGKTTLMRILNGNLLADEGEVIMGGCSLERDPLAARRLIGYLGEIPPLYGTMTLREYLYFVAGLKGIFPIKTQMIDELSETLDLTERLSHTLQTLSKGFKQRVGLAAALIGDPPILLLDEPSTGLDPKQANEFRKKILALKGKQTILFSSHLLGEVEAMSDEVKLLHEGKLLEPKRSQEWSLVFKIKTAGSDVLVKFVERFLKRPSLLGEPQKYVVMPPSSQTSSDFPKTTPKALTWKDEWYASCMTSHIELLQPSTKMYALSIYFTDAVVEQCDAISSFLNLALLEHGMLVSTIEKKQPSLEEEFLSLLREQHAGTKVRV